jgi:hypothetical protein
MLTDDGLIAHRDAYGDAIRAFHVEGKMARTWPLRFLIRHTAFHTLDHTWEMEDKDLSGNETPPDSPTASSAQHPGGTRPDPPPTLKGECEPVDSS